MCKNAEEITTYSELKTTNMALQQKVIEYGTTHTVKVLASSQLVLTLVDEQSNEGYVLAYHGMDPLPAVGSTGTIVFERNAGPAKGHWQFYPDKK